MKKLYLLLVALIVATIPALAADWYLVGSGMTKRWSRLQMGEDFKPFALETVSEGVYKIDGVIFQSRLPVQRLNRPGHWEYSVK